MAVSRSRKKKHAVYDKKVKRFRDAKGRFLSRERGLKSKYARQTYLRIVAKKPKAEKKLKAPKKLPEFGRSIMKKNQYLIFGIAKWSKLQLATLILKRIKDGYERFRFFYRLGKTSEYMPGGVASTPGTDKLSITKNNTLEEVIAFLKGENGIIMQPSRIFSFWYAK